MRDKVKTITLYDSVGAESEQSLSNDYEEIINDSTAYDNGELRDSDRYFSEEELLETLIKHGSRPINDDDPLYREFVQSKNLNTVTMNELYDRVYQSKPPVIDGLIYPGTYLFAGAPNLGKSFLMMEPAYHVATGNPLWGFPVRKGTVLYLAIEDDERRLQERLYRMFGSECTENLLLATKAESVKGNLMK